MARGDLTRDVSPVCNLTWAGLCFFPCPDVRGARLVCEHWEFGNVGWPCYCSFTNNADSSFGMVNCSGCSWLWGYVGFVVLMLIWGKGLFFVHLLLLRW